MRKNGLIIAGFDPSAGAGLLMDIKVFSAIGIYAFAVPTAIVEENTDTVKSITPVTPAVLRGQLGILLGNSGVHGVKIGMLSGRKTAQLVQETIRRYRLKNIVLDPVLLSSSGTSLFRGDIKSTIDALLPFCTIVTPNIPEASILSGVQIKSKGDMMLSANYFLDRGAEAVVIKGGHFIRKGLDLYRDRKQHIFFEAKALQKDVHGTGCILSSAITAYLIKGYDKPGAVKRAKQFTFDAIKNSRRVSPSLHRSVGMPSLNNKIH
ncbi:MAG: bifunctional hydroxymethylpyrimidine kinase/phosphomethylpyrimidine kinase [Deltaproteobacteria bacterium]|nr:bifunctional hydroxymethylpyrimidine kinase/phosphomethylpyrimidine kinase [Deltaproteobacteria bacterium]